MYYTLRKCTLASHVQSAAIMFFTVKQLQEVFGWIAQQRRIDDKNSEGVMRVRPEKSGKKLQIYTQCTHTHIHSSLDDVYLHQDYHNSPQTE